MATKTQWPDAKRPDLAQLAAVIARSLIVVPRLARRRLPAGFDAVDVIMLDWIAAEARRMGRRLVRM